MTNLTNNGRPRKAGKLAKTKLERFSGQIKAQARSNCKESKRCANLHGLPAWTNGVPFNAPSLLLLPTNRTLHYTWRFAQFWLWDFVRHHTRSEKEYVPCKHHTAPSAHAHAPLTFQLNPPMIIRVIARYIAFVWIVPVPAGVSLDFQSLLDHLRIEGSLWAVSCLMREILHPGVCDHAGSLGARCGG
jgi:hypothetical protein